MSLALFTSFFAALTLLAAPAKHVHKHHRHGHVAAPVETVFTVNQAPLSPNTKIFLVAGSSLASSFAREIVEQKKLWLAAGFKEDEIACYYTVPFQEDFNDETEPFQKLAPELAKCYPANMKLLRQHLAKAGTTGAKPPFVYLYVTSHGDQPPAETLLKAKPSDADYWQLKREAAYPALDQYRLLLEGLPDGTAGQAELLGAFRMGVPAEDLYLTPKHLRGLLDRAFAGVPKFVVLQGCFSGGFIHDPEPRRASELLSTLPDITVLAAAKNDRSSFGCEPGPVRTFFGGAYNDELAKVAADPRRINWRELWLSVVRKIGQLEREQKIDTPSLPQFFSNRPAH